VRAEATQKKGAFALLALVPLLIGADTWLRSTLFPQLWQNFALFICAAPQPVQNIFALRSSDANVASFNQMILNYNNYALIRAGLGLSQLVGV
jgi:hypothetical protein